MWKFRQIIQGAAEAIGLIEFLKLMEKSG